MVATSLGFTNGSPKLPRIIKQDGDGERSKSDQRIQQYLQHGFEIECRAADDLEHIGADIG